MAPALRRPIKTDTLDAHGNSSPDRQSKQVPIFTLSGAPFLCVSDPDT